MVLINLNKKGRDEILVSIILAALLFTPLEYLKEATFIPIYGELEGLFWTFIFSLGIFLILIALLLPKKGT